MHHNAYLFSEETPHHIDRDLFIALMQIKSPLLEEIFDDQASITGRYYRKVDKPREYHKKCQDKVYHKGIRFREGSGIIYWNQSTFISYFSAVPEIDQKELWKKWENSNTCFTKFWKEMFGSRNQCWNPPVPRDKWHVLQNKFKA